MMPAQALNARLDFLSRVARRECEYLLDTDRRLFVNEFSIEVAGKIAADPVLAERLDAFVQRLAQWARLCAYVGSHSPPICGRSRAYPAAPKWRKPGNISGCMFWHRSPSHPLGGPFERLGKTQGVIAHGFSSSGRTAIERPTPVPPRALSCCPGFRHLSGDRYLVGQATFSAGRCAGHHGLGSALTAQQATGERAVRPFNFGDGEVMRMMVCA